VPLNLPQSLFLDQARSDYETFGRLSRSNICHRLHYLQMSTEKLSKVYFWRGGIAPGLGHFTFEPFLRALNLRADFHRMFGYTDSRRFTLQRPAILNLAARLQRLAPAGGNQGPNAEYPWPPANPTNSPLTHTFLEWTDWNETTGGRRLRYFVENMLNNYLVYFP
jgi:hypothetical protein